MSQILSVAASSSGTVTLTNQRDQFLVVNIGAAGTIDNLTVTGSRSGAIVQSLDTTGVQWLGSQAGKSALSSVFILPMGLGRDSSESVTFTLQTGAGNAVTLSTYSINSAPNTPCYVYSALTVNGGSTQNFNKFFAVVFSPSDSDVYVINGMDGTSSQVNQYEIQALANYETNLGSSPFTSVDNWAQRIKSFSAQPAAQKTFYSVSLNTPK